MVYACDNCATSTLRIGDETKVKRWSFGRGGRGLTDVLLGNGGWRRGGGVDGLDYGNGRGFRTGEN